jgi:hypothetical protein
VFRILLFYFFVFCSVNLQKPGKLKDKQSIITSDCVTQVGQSDRRQGHRYGNHQ